MNPLYIQPVAVETKSKSKPAFDVIGDEEAQGVMEGARFALSAVRHLRFTDGINTFMLDLNTPGTYICRIVGD